MVDDHARALPRRSAPSLASAGSPHFPAAPGDPEQRHLVEHAECNPSQSSGTAPGAPVRATGPGSTSTTEPAPVHLSVRCRAVSWPRGTSARVFDWQPVPSGLPGNHQRLAPLPGNGRCRPPSGHQVPCGSAPKRAPACRSAGHGVRPFVGDLGEQFPPGSEPGRKLRGPTALRPPIGVPPAPAGSTPHRPWRGSGKTLNPAASDILRPIPSRPPFADLPSAGVTFEARSAYRHNPSGSCPRAADRGARQTL